MRLLIPLLIHALFITALSAQTENASSERYVSPALTDLQVEEMEVEYFAHQLQQLKDAYTAGNISNVIVRESAVVMALRNEINQLELKLAASTAQAERRKSATSGVITRAASPDEAPKRDPLADAVTPDEIRLETMQYTLAAFDRHAFDPGKPEEAARDFAKLDNILKIMREALAELKAARG